MWSAVLEYLKSLPKPSETSIHKHISSGSRTDHAAPSLASKRGGCLVEREFCCIRDRPSNRRFSYVIIIQIGEKGTIKRHVTAEILSHEDIEFISVADVTPDVESCSLVRLEDVEIVVDVFQLFDRTEDLAPSNVRSRNNSNNDSDCGKDDEIPQAKVTDLPSRHLDGIWRSYAGLFYTLQRQF